MILSGGGIPQHFDPHLRRWMLFIDGENFTLRAQAYAQSVGITLKEGENYLKDIFIWLPGVSSTENLYKQGNIKLQENAIRSYYYASLAGDDQKLFTVKTALHSLSFHPAVFKKTRKEEKAKGVDITMAKDILGHAFSNNYDAAVLIAGDGDYCPLVEEIKRLGKVVYVAFFAKKEFGLSSDLVLASDRFFDLTDDFLNAWQKYVS